MKTTQEREEDSILQIPDEVKQRMGIVGATSFAEARDACLWGTRGPECKDPVTYKRLVDLDTNHLENILCDQPLVIWEQFSTCRF